MTLSTTVALLVRVKETNVSRRKKHRKPYVGFKMAVYIRLMWNLRPIYGTFAIRLEWTYLHPFDSRHTQQHELSEKYNHKHMAISETKIVVVEICLVLSPTVVVSIVVPADY